MGLVALLHVESSWTRDWTGVPCFGRLILHHWTTRTVLTDSLIFSSSWLKFSLCSSVLFLSSIAFLITFTLNSSSDKLFTSASLGFFQVFFFLLFLKHISLSVFLLCLTFSVFMKIGETVTFLVWKVCPCMWVGPCSLHVSSDFGGRAGFEVSRNAYFCVVCWQPLSCWVGLGLEGLASASAVLSGQCSPIRCEVRNRNPERARFSLDVASTLIRDVPRPGGSGLNFCAGFAFSPSVEPWLKVSGEQCQSKRGWAGAWGECGVHWSGPPGQPEPRAGFSLLAPCCVCSGGSGFPGEPRWLSNQLRVLAPLGPGLGSGVEVIQLCAMQSVGFPRPEYCSRWLFPSPGDLPNPGSNPGLPHCGWILYQMSYQGRCRCASNALLPREDPWACSILLFYDSHQGCGFPPFLPDSVWLFLYRLDCTGAVLLVPRSISVRISLYVIVVLIFSWGEVRSISFYSAILISTFYCFFLFNIFKLFFQSFSFYLKNNIGFIL